MKQTGSGSGAGIGVEPWAATAVESTVLGQWRNGQFGIERS